MKPDDPSIRWVEEPKLGLADKMYLPLFFQGLGVTAKHLVAPKVTVNYPDEEPQIDNPLIYRGVHRLNKDEQGRVKCVACFLCATACPAHCIVPRWYSASRRPRSLRPWRWCPRSASI